MTKEEATAYVIKYLNIKTLETEGRDSLDFFEISKWQMKHIIDVLIKNNYSL